jgi:uncharacterized protein
VAAPVLGSIGRCPTSNKVPPGATLFAIRLDHVFHGAGHVDVQANDQIVVPRLRRPGREITLDPVDALHDIGPSRLGHRPPVSQCRWREVHRRDLPAMRGEPERVCAMSTAGVEGASRRKVGSLGRQMRVGRAGRDRKRRLGRSKGDNHPPHGRKNGNALAIRAGSCARVCTIATWVIITHYMVDPVSRLLSPSVRDRLKRSPAVIVTGARQTGKTTLVRSLVGDRKRRYETLDSLTTLDRARHEPDALIAGGRPITLDEVQRAPELLLSIKRSIDDDRAPGRFLLTGSASFQLLKGVGDSLAGRSTHLVMRPLTESEKRGKPACVWPRLLSAKVADELVDLVSGPGTHWSWRDGALRGGFPPAAFAASADDRALWFEGYVDTYVQRDVRELAQVGDAPAFLRLVKLAAVRNGGLLNQAELARDAGLSGSTAQRWLSILQGSYLLVLVDAFAETMSKRLIKAPKLYFCDTGLGLHLTNAGSASELRSMHNAGSWLEALVLNDLLVWRETELRKPSILHYRSAGGEEIDFVVEQQRRLLPIEIKARSAVRVSDARAVDAFCAEMGPARAPFGIVIYDGREVIRLSKSAVALPVTAALGAA